MLKIQKFNQGMCRFPSVFFNFALAVCKAEVFLCSRKVSVNVFLHITFVMVVLVSSTGIPVEKPRAD